MGEVVKVAVEVLSGQALGLYGGRAGLCRCLFLFPFLLGFHFRSHV